MDPEDKKKLDRLLLISENNNRLLRRMRREVLWMRFFRVVYLVVILGAIVAGYLYFSPYFGSFQNALNVLGQLKNFQLPANFTLPSLPK